MHVRVLQTFEFTGPRKQVATVHPGQVIDVWNRQTLQRLLEQHRVCHVNQSHTAPVTPLGPAPAMSRTLRVGAWLQHTSHYSGGRIHVYQYCHSLATAGAEVFFVTTGTPRWVGDYPDAAIKFLMDGKDPPPDDLDIVMTDSKGPTGMRALAYKENHPAARFVCLNFETANWVEKFVPSIARSMNKQHLRAGYAAADLLLGNSLPSMDYLMAWMGETRADRRYDFLAPGLNTYRTDAQPAIPAPGLPARPYGVWCARNTSYKNANLAQEAVWAMDEPFDLVTLGEPGDVLRDTALHQLHAFKNAPDAVKFALYRGARAVLAPSLFEGFGMVPFEALSVGTPCVVYDLPVLRWAYGDRLVYVPWGDDAAFAATAREVARAPKPDLQREKAWVRKTYGMGAMAERIERLPWHRVKTRHVTACMICYSTPTATHAIRSVYEHVDKIVVAYGPVQRWLGHPEGGVLETIRSMPDPDKKIMIEARDVWPDKRTMRVWCSEQIEGNYQLILDADELWFGLDKWLEGGEDFAGPRYVTLWHSGEWWIHDKAPGGSRWGGRLEPYGSVCAPYRFSLWRPTYRWKVHSTPTDHAGQPLHLLARSRAADMAVPGAMIYHLGHALSGAMMARKHGFYEARDHAPAARRAAWAGWRGEAGECPDGIVEGVTWEIPDLVREALCQT